MNEINDSHKYIFWSHVTYLTQSRVFVLSVSPLLSFFLKFISGKQKKTVNGAEARIDEQPHYFTISLQKLAIHFFRTLMEETRQSYNETVKAFRQRYNEKPVAFQWKPTRRVFSKVYWVKSTSYLERTVIWFYSSLKASTILNKTVF